MLEAPEGTSKVGRGATGAGSPGEHFPRDLEGWKMQIHLHVQSPVTELRNPWALKEAGWVSHPCSDTGESGRSRAA